MFVLLLVCSTFWHNHSILPPFVLHYQLQWSHFILLTSDHSLSHSSPSVHSPSPGADAADSHCCQCSTQKELTLISIVKFSFLKTSESSCGWHCSETLTSVWGYNFSCCAVFNTIRNSVQCVVSVLACFPTTNQHIFWVARSGLFWNHGF